MLESLSGSFGGKLLGKPASGIIARGPIPAFIRFQFTLRRSILDRNNWSDRQ